MLGIKCDPDDWRKICTINLNLGPAEEHVSSISIRINPPDSIHMMSQNPVFDSRLFDNMTWPVISKWENYNVSSSFSQRFSIRADSIVIFIDVMLHIFYLSSDLSQLIHDFYATYLLLQYIFD